MSNNNYIIIAYVLSNNDLTLITKEGQRIVLNQGDARISQILDKITNDINNTGYSEITLEPIKSIYKLFSDLTEGLVRFMSSSNNKISEEAISDFNKKNISDYSSEKVSAIVEDSILPGVEKLINQFNNAVQLGNKEGIINFLKRANAVNEHRQHSVEDLLTFIEKGDLPIADDGSIIIYKILRKNGDHYIDCHSRKVKQKVGSYVCMSQDLVDHDRRNECSNGLHVARRGYIKHFPGDVCVAAKVAPEDVIAVPQYDANKMRVCGYHIVKELPDEAYQSLKNDLPITNTEEGQNILANIVKGNHISKIEEVKITGHKGEGLIISPLVSSDIKKEQENIFVKAINIEVPVTEQAERIDVKKFSDKINKKEQDMTVVEKIEELYNKVLSSTTRKTQKKYMIELFKVKRASKQSFEYFGFDSRSIYDLKNSLNVT